ncbi:P-loop containing nucleoside triphosphate hydrolase protein [Microthyrium microscopicum]|uniref:RNA helicase n=1 Tax=Microthyrium microscopicum TaxID=703497 RepID=A0A6A6U8P1_9PEZI|nr:P-loop containing nucleoside triphosphate hydrolase protein [Microthyrium microscopicum]
MARRDTRSPSPTGSTRRPRRDDDRNSRRDETRSYRARSRSTERRRRDPRDSHRRNDIDRRDDRRDEYRSARRDRSRDRDRRRSRSPRGGQRSSKDFRDRKDGDRRRRDESTDSKRRSKRDGSRDRATSSRAEDAEAAKLAEAEKKKAERLARLDAWKKKQAAEQEAKLKEAAASGGANILLEMDKKANSPSATASPGSPATGSGNNSPAAYAGKFDPKAIMKKATSNHASQSSTAALGALSTDVPVPVVVVNEKANAPKNTSLPKARPLKATGNLGGFGLGIGTKSGTEKKRALDFGEEEGTRKKLAKLPIPQLEHNEEDTVMANADEEEDEEDGDGIDEAGSEEEALAAARAAAERRQKEQEEAEAEAAPADVPMNDATAETNGVEEEEEEEEEEEVDPLDAFMADLSEAPKTFVRKSLKSKQEPEAMFGDDDYDGPEDTAGTADATPDEILKMASKKKKRDIPPIDHSKYTYEPFRKSFYSEPIDMQEMTEEDVANMRFEMDGIKVRGLNAPKPVTSWAQCGTGVQTMDVIRSLGYDKPTAIQCQAIPAIMSGRDVIGVAKTGSGKTIAFLLPMFRHIKDQRPIEGMDGPVGLVLAPTRELATQIHKECKPFLKALNLRAVCAYGGAPIKDQIADLKRGAEIVVCTPGRLIELLSANAGRVTNLRRVTYMVLDEADRMFDMGFEPQVMKILGNTRPDRQTVLFSATFPRNMESLARKTLNNAVEIIVGGRSVVASEITQIVEVRTENSKFLRLLELLGELYDQDEDARTLIFVDRQEAADGLLRELMRKGYPCNSIHGGKDQIDRDSTIDDFKAGVIPIMIATSVAARGLDVKQLKLVVNYDSPNHLEDYVHRAGRTGRAGNKGTAVTFITEEQEKYAIDIRKALKQSGTEVPEALEALAKGFAEKVKSGQAKQVYGFGGHGLERLDEERDATRLRERKTHATGDEPEEEKEEDNDDDIITKAASTVTSAAAVPAFPQGLDEKDIVVHKTEIPAASGSSGPGNSIDKVRAAVATIADRLTKRNQLNPGHPIDNKGPDAGAFHATLEINDFPQKARWAVTNRTNVAKILEATGTSITTKGNFYPAQAAAKLGPDDAPKLYILVEGDTENVVTNAMRELMRLLKEGTIAAADVDARAPASGRYSVV